MPFIEVTTRKSVNDNARATLADRLTRLMIHIEAGEGADIPASLAISWVTFGVIDESNWAVGGQFGGLFADDLTFVLARVIAPEAMLTASMKKAVHQEVTAAIRQTLQVPDSDDGRGINVQIVEVPEGSWSVNGVAGGVRAVLSTMGGLTPERRRAIDDHFDGHALMRAEFHIPG